MKIVSLSIVIIFGGLLLVHYYRQYYNYTTHIKSTFWPCEIDELGNCVKQIKLNKCPDYWQQSLSKDENNIECRNIHTICPANSPNCKNKKGGFPEPTSSVNLSPSLTLANQCQWSSDTKYSWDGACERLAAQQSTSNSVGTS